MGDWVVLLYFIPFFSPAENGFFVKEGGYGILILCKVDGFDLVSYFILFFLCVVVFFCVLCALSW